MGTVKLWDMVNMLLMGTHIKRRKTSICLINTEFLPSLSQALPEPWSYQNEQDMVETIKKSTTSLRKKEHLITGQDVENQEAHHGTQERMTHLLPMESQITDLKVDAVRWRRMLGQ